MALRKITIAAVLLVALQACQILALGSTTTGSLLSNVCQTLASLLAAAACFATLRKSQKMCRLFWLLIGSGLGCWGLSNLGWTYYEVVLHTVPPAASAVRFLFEVPLMFFAIALFLDPERDSPHFSTELVLDSLQIVIAFSFLFPLVYTVEIDPNGSHIRGIWVLLIESAVLILLAIIQMARDNRPHIRSLYGGFLLFIVGYSVVEYLDFAYEDPGGTWHDLQWTLILLGGALWAASWRPEREAQTLTAVRPRTIGKLMVTNATIALAPLIILFEVQQVGPEQHFLRFSLLGISIVCFAARLGLSEYRQSQQLESLRQRELQLESAKSELSVQKAFLEQLIESAPEAIALVDLNMIVQRVNQEFTRLFGYTPGDACGQPLDDLIVPADKNAEASSLNQKVLGGHTAALETVRKGKDGFAIDVSVLVSPVKLGEGKGAIYCIYRDIRARKQVESQLRQSQKMEAVGRLAGGVAHDFNNLLGVILGHTEILGQQVGSAERKKTQAIEAAVKRASSLTNQLLAFSRKQVLQLAVLNLNAVAAETEKMLRRLIGEDIRLDVQLDPDLGAVRADSGQIVQTILNLAINSRDAMPNGGSLAIKTSNVNFGEGTVRQGVPVPAGAYVLLSVSDTGTGMDAEILAHTFEPFFTTKPVGKGTGLGLATVYGIVKQSAGYIFADSEVGKGTTFQIYLPRVQESVEPPAVQKSRTETPKGSETILLVEDEAALLELISANLQNSGYSVLEASDGVEALYLAEKHDGVIHVLVTDVVMPQMSGPELSRRLTAQRPEVKLLFMSGYADNALTPLGALDENVIFLQKPFELGRLAQKVREALDETPASVS
ncbi:MAG: response regulator [Terriglobales bacterium]